MQVRELMRAVRPDQVMVELDDERLGVLVDFGEQQVKRAVEFTYRLRSKRVCRADNREYLGPKGLLRPSRWRGYCRRFPTSLILRLFLKDHLTSRTDELPLLR